MGTTSNAFLETTNNVIKIKVWYVKEYKTDELGENINDNVTFEDLFNTLDTYGDVYKLLGVGDSVIRERVFGKLAEIMEVDYDYIYEQWLKC